MENITVVSEVIESLIKTIEVNESSEKMSTTEKLEGTPTLINESFASKQL